jgi:hypothetical protein
VTRARSFRLWTVALWALCLLAATGSLTESSHPAAAALGSRAAVGVLSAAADPAVLPAKAVDEIRVAAQSAPLRILVPAAVVAMLVGLLAALRRRSPATGPMPRPLRARLHAIALRAPPLQFAR